jgi:hypothetical protein
MSKAQKVTILLVEDDPGHACRAISIGCDDAGWEVSVLGISARPCGHGFSGESRAVKG